MDPMTTIAGVAGAIKSIADLVGGLRGKKKADPETEKVLLEIETRLVALKTEVLSLKEREIHLLEENARLRAKISSKEEGTLERQKYQRKQVGQATVMIRDDEPGVYYCATCYAKDKLIPLQAVPDLLQVMGSHSCSECHSYLSIG
jgi:hypothetical protein